MTTDMAIEPDSTQINADDLIAGPRTVTIDKVTRGNTEQPVNISLVETPGRAWRPSKSMRRVLVAAWGPDTTAYTGRRVTLYREPSIKFGREVVGGIRVSHLSHISKPLTVPLTVARGKRETFTVQPLPDSPAPAPAPTAEDVAATDDTEQLRAMWHAADQDVRNLIEARVAELNTKPADVDPFDQDGDDQ